MGGWVGGWVVRVCACVRSDYYNCIVSRGIIQLVTLFQNDDLSVMAQCASRP